MRHKLAQLPVHLIISVDDNALDFLLKNRNVFSPKIPIVFCGVNDFHDKRIAGHKNITGVNEVIDMEETIKIALRLHPKAKNLVAIQSDYQTHWRNTAELFKKITPAFSELVKIQEIMNLRIEDAPSVLRAISPDSIVLSLADLLEDGKKDVDRKKGWRFLSEHSAAPVYTLWETGLGTGIVGGKMVSGFHQGEAAARIARRILRGEAVSNIPVLLKSPNVAMFDWNALKRFGIREKDLPPNSQVFFKPFSFYERHRIWFWIIPGFIIIESWLIFALMISRKRRAGVMRALIESEEKYRSLYEDAPVCYMEFDTGGHITRVNQRGLEIFGHTAEEMVGEPVWNFVMEREEARDLVQSKLVGDKPPGRNLERTYIRKDGAAFSGLIEDVILKDSSDRIIGIRSVIQDITARKQAEEALSESEKKYRALFEAESDALVIADRETAGILEVNEAALKLYGYTREEMTALKVTDFTTEPEKALNALIESRPVIPIRYQKRKDGSTFPAEITVNNLELAGKKLRISALRDISERVRAEEDRKRLEAQLRQAQKLESIGKLAGGIAHDFNNILSPILIHTEMALMELPEGNPIRHNLRQVYKAGERARDLVKQILAFSRQSKPERIAFSVTPVVKEALRLIRSSLPTTIEIKQSIQAEKDTVFADPTQVHQILMNLCTNASHAMRERSGVLEVGLRNVDLDPAAVSRIHGLKPGSYLRLDVRDTGHGMEPSVLERIFDPFFTTKEVGEGTGMGLSLIHGIVADLGGTVTVESEQGKGSAFHVFLPIHEKAAPLKPADEIRLPLGSEHILFVDDEKAMVSAIQPMLENLGYKVTARTSSIEALEAFRNDPGRFDLVITDMTMPNMTGDELAAEVMGIRPDIPVILCSGFSERIDEHKAKAMGIRAYVMKPIVMREMAKKIRDVLDKK
ncbi:MAG: ABC transporter substrate binding protein [Pseudomonadota bacterium]